MRHLDRQLAIYRDRLVSEVGLESSEIGKVATLVAADFRFLSAEVKAEIKAASPVPISARYEELVAFQLWNDFVSVTKKNPGVGHAAVIVQNYVCFVYLKDACFDIVASRVKSESVIWRCASYLTREKVRDFRNAFSHGNWHYNDARSGLNCWVLEDARRPQGAMRNFEVSQADLNFWQALFLAESHTPFTNR